MEQAKQALEGILDEAATARSNCADRVRQLDQRVVRSAASMQQDQPRQGQTVCQGTRREHGRHRDRQRSARAYRWPDAQESADVFLVTDGEVSDWETVVDEAKKSGHRIFTVGVGSAVSEAFVRELAAGTGGECELVSPREGNGGPRRPSLRTARAAGEAGGSSLARWRREHHPGPDRRGLRGRHGSRLCTLRSRAGHGAAILEVETDKGETVRQELAFPATRSTLPRTACLRWLAAAAARLKELDDVVGLETALRYRLVSPWTNWLVVAPRTDEEKARTFRPCARSRRRWRRLGWRGQRGDVPQHGCVGGPCVRCIRSVDFAAMEDFDLSEIETPRRSASRPARAHRRLLELVDANASRLDVAGALDLLTESGLAAEFDDLFRHTRPTRPQCHDVVAAIVPSRLLGGPSASFFPATRKWRWHLLQERAREATDALQQMGRHGVA